MKKRIREFTNLSLYLSNNFDTEKMFVNFPTILKNEIYNAVLFIYIQCFYQYFAPFKILNNIESKYTGFLNILWPLLRCYGLKRDDFLYRIGEDLNETYFISEGELLIVSNETKPYRVSVGSMLGELLATIPPNICVLSCHECLCLQDSRVLSIRQDDLLTIKDKSILVYNEFKKQLVENYKIKQVVYIESGYENVDKRFNVTNVMYYI